MDSTNFDFANATFQFTGDNRYMICSNETEEGTIGIKVLRIESIDYREVSIQNFDEVIEAVNRQYNVSDDDFGKIYALLDADDVESAEIEAEKLRARLPFDPELNGIFTSIELMKLD